MVGADCRRRGIFGGASEEAEREDMTRTALATKLGIEESKVAQHVRGAFRIVTWKTVALSLRDGSNSGKGAWRW
jgi:hypothetical protein